jgi:protein-tyrosine phosphatase
MIDIHSHMIPGVDDGPTSWEVALEMAQIARQDGIEHVVATPHANDTYQYDRELLESLLPELEQKAGETPRFSLGCEVHLSYSNLQDVFAYPHRYAIGETQYVLVELSVYGIPPHLEEVFFRLQAADLKPILAHPERHIQLQRDPDRVLQWIKAGCVIQVTASALSGFWRESAKKMAEWLLKHDAVHVLATDAHDATRRPPVLSRGRDVVAKLCSQQIADALTVDNPAAIVAGKSLPYRPSPIIRS